MRTVRIDGKTWKLTRRRSPARSEDNGACYQDRKLIYLSPDIETRSKLINVIAHEVLHAFNWHIDEDYVQEFGDVVERVILELIPDINDQ